MSDGQTPPPPHDPHAAIPPAPQPGSPVPPPPAGGFDPSQQPAPQPGMPVPPAPIGGFTQQPIQPGVPAPPPPAAGLDPNQSFAQQPIAGAPVPTAPQPGMPVPPVPAGQPVAGAPAPAAPQPGMPVPPAPAGQPAAGQPPVASPLQSDDELDESQFITGGDDHSFIKTVPVPPHPNTQFDDTKFLELLAGSISLTKTEKQRIITSIPKLTQYQVDELIRIFTEEQAKFAELNQKHADQLKELEARRKDDWDDVATQAQRQEAEKKDDEDADALRKKLGLN